MSTSAIVSAALALVAAALFAVSLAFQQRGNLQALRGEGRARNQVLATVLQPWWFGGIALSLVGFVIYAVALNLGSLTVAQPLQVTQLIFTVPLGAWVAGTAVERGEWRGAVLVVGGLAAFLVVLAPQANDAVGSRSSWAVAVPVVLGLAVVAFVAGRALPDLRRPVGATAGLVLGLQGAVLKEASATVAGGVDLGDPVGLWSLPTVGVLSLAGTFIANLALRSGRLSAAQTTLAGVPPLLGVVLGLAVFGEQVRTAPLALAAAAVAMAVCLVGVSLLARSPSLLALTDDGATSASVDDAVDDAATGYDQSSRS